MKQYLLIMVLTVSMAGPSIAAEADVKAEAGVQAQSEQGFFSSAWGSVKSFFGGSDETQVPEKEAAVEEAREPSMIDKAADGTKAGVDWTADKTKKGAEWTADTAVNVKDGAVDGAKAVGGAVKKGAVAVGGAVKGVFTSDTEVAVDAEASAEAK